MAAVVYQHFVGIILFYLFLNFQYIWLEECFTLQSVVY